MQRDVLVRAVDLGTYSMFNVGNDKLNKATHLSKDGRSDSESHSWNETLTLQMHPDAPPADAQRETHGRSLAVRGSQTLTAAHTHTHALYSHAARMQPLSTDNSGVHQSDKAHTRVVTGEGDTY